MKNGTPNAVEMFTAYALLPREERQRFQAMAAGYDFRDQRNTDAGKKAARTKQENAAAAPQA